MGYNGLCCRIDKTITENLHFIEDKKKVLCYYLRKSIRRLYNERFWIQTNWIYGWIEEKIHYTCLRQIPIALGCAITTPHYLHNSLDTKTLCFYTCILDLPIFHISFGYSFLWYIQHILIHSSLVVFPQAYVRGLHIRYVTYNSISCVINYVSHLYYSWWYSSFCILRCDFADHTRIIKQGGFFLHYHSA